MKKIKIKKDFCIGCGACVGESNGIIEFDDNGKASCSSCEFDDNKAEEIKNVCPVDAIEIND